MEERGFGVFNFGFLFQCPSEVKKGFSYLAVFVIVGFLDLGDGFFPFFCFSISHPARQRNVALQTFSAAMLDFSEEVQKWRFFCYPSEQISDAVVGFFNSINLRLYRKPR